MAEIQIRSMKDADYPVFDRFDGALHRMHVEARPDLFRPCGHPLSLEAYQQMLRDPQEELFLAETGGVPAGLCAVTLQAVQETPLLLPCKSAHIGDLYVAPEFRKLGIGTALYREAERRAKAFGAERLDLMVWPFNQNALAFYRRLGMEIRSYTMEAKL